MEIKNESKEIGTIKEKRKIFYFKKIKLHSLLLSPNLISYINNDISKAKNELSFFKIDLLIQDIVNKQKKENYSYSQKYNCFKKILDFEESQRKTELDSLLKKCKIRFSKSFNKIVYKLLKEIGKYYKLPVKFVKNINIAFNYEFLNYTIIEIYKKYNININYDLLKNQINKKNYELFIYLINKTFKELYIEYINSKVYIYHSEMIEKKDGIKLKLLFKYTSQIFVEYYSNKSKTKNISKLFSEKRKKYKYSCSTKHSNKILKS